MPRSPTPSPAHLASVSAGWPERSTRLDRRSWKAWVEDLQSVCGRPPHVTPELLTAEADPIHPARIYGELLPRLADDAVVIGDGGDFVSFAGKFVEPQRPGVWLYPAHGAARCSPARAGDQHRRRCGRRPTRSLLALGSSQRSFRAPITPAVRHLAGIGFLWSDSGTDLCSLPDLHLVERTLFHFGADNVLAVGLQLGDCADVGFAPPDWHSRRTIIPLAGECTTVQLDLIVGLWRAAPSPA